MTDLLMIDIDFDVSVIFNCKTVKRQNYLKRRRDKISINFLVNVNSLFLLSVYAMADNRESRTKVTLILLQYPPELGELSAKLTK